MSSGDTMNDRMLQSWNTGTSLGTGMVCPPIIHRGSVNGSPVARRSARSSSASQAHCAFIHSNSAPLGWNGASGVDDFHVDD